MNVWIKIFPLIFITSCASDIFIPDCEYKTYRDNLKCLTAWEINRNV